MLTDTQITELAKRMSVPLVFCGFKTELADNKLKYNKSYIVNMQDALSPDGKQNEGTHYVCFQANKYPNGKVEKIYFDSFGMPPPQEVIKFLGKGTLPHNIKDIQSLMNGACGYYCLALLHYINASHVKTGDLYTDCEEFTDLFDDLAKVKDHLKNEYILQQFFMAPKNNRDFKLGENPNFEKESGGGVAAGIANPNTIITEDEDYKLKHI